MLKSALLVTAGIVIGFGVNAVLAQNNAPTTKWPKSTSKTKPRMRPVALIRFVTE